MPRPLLLAVAIGFALSYPGASAAPGLKNKVNKDDLKKLQGDWTITSWQQLGQNIGVAGTWSFKGRKYTLDQGGGALEEGTIKLDQGKKPGAFDLDITAGNCGGKAQPGIYKIEGDTLTLCLAWPGMTNRPTEFSTSAANQWILITLKRAK